MTAPDTELPAGLFAYCPSQDGHTCASIATFPANDGRCTTCERCTPHRLRHIIHRPDGTTHLVLRCSHCDGPDAHHTLKKEAA